MSDWAYEDFDTGITEEAWVDLLNNNDVFEIKHLQIMKRLKNSPDEAATCTQLSKNFGEKKSFYRVNSLNLCAKIKSAINCRSPEDKGCEYWPILYVGKKCDGCDGPYLWKLRKELSLALDKVDLSSIDLQGQPARSFSESLKRVITERPDDEIEQYVSENDYFKINSAAYESLKSILNNDGYSFGKYSGQNHLYKDGVVWMGFKDKRESNSHQFTNGVYVVYLFAVDRSCVYLTLAQGVSDYRASERDQILESNCEKIRSAIACPEGFTANNDVDLGSTGDYAVQYQKSVIFWKRYVPDEMPEDDELLLDLHNLMIAYGEYERRINNRVNYWIFRHNNSGDDDAIRQLAFKDQCCLMQYEYGIQANSQVAKTLMQAASIQFGDVVFFSQGKRIMAYGYATHASVVLNDLYSDYKDKTLTHLNHLDDVFGFVGRPLYFDFVNDPYDPEGGPWGQRLAVEEWYILEDPVYIDGDWLDDSVKQNSINRIKRQKGESVLGITNTDGIQNEGEQEMDQFVAEVSALLKERKNVILQGAPGTGKTYNTAAIAVAVVNPEFSDWTHDAVMKEYSRLRDEEHLIDFVTFHQSMDYETFVRGIRPVPAYDEQGRPCGMSYPVVPGAFLRMCERAMERKGSDVIKSIDSFIESIQDKPMKIPRSSGRGDIWVWSKLGSEVLFVKGGRNPEPDALNDHGTMWPNIEKIKSQALNEGVENNWTSEAASIIEYVKRESGILVEPGANGASEANDVVLIIDEINRGNISRILGELITLLEPDKRLGEDNEIKVTLPYSKEGEPKFGVPSSLYILGTMNTTDRSTGSIDYALRRRFAFKTTPARVDIIEKFAGDEIKDVSVNLFWSIYGFLNDKEKSRADMDIDDLMVGHSYFLAKTKKDLESSFRYGIVPLIWEYQKDGIIGVSEEDLRTVISSWERILNGSTDSGEANALDG